MARYSVIMASCPKRLYTEEQAGIYMGYPAVFERVLKAKPVFSKCHSMTARTWTNVSNG
jgi:hypothetical protein